MIFRKRRDWQDQYDEDYGKRAGRHERIMPLRPWLHILALAFVAAIFVGSVGVVSGQRMFEKTLTAIASPVGLLWVMLMVMIYFCLLLRQSWPATVGFLCWLNLTIFGNGFIANEMARRIEAPYLATDPFHQDPYDVVFVLGGGTTTNLQNRAQLDINGDRVATAARLFHAGLARKLVCTGLQAVRTTSKDLHPYQEATEILVGLDVPEEFIARIPGENTAAEMRGAVAFLKENNLTDVRIGILTSAWHLNRAMRLARNQGLEAHAIPADFLTQYFEPSPNLLIPSADSLSISARIIKEYLAGLVNR